MNDNSHSHTHTYGPFRETSSYNVHVFSYLEIKHAKNMTIEYFTNYSVKFTLNGVGKKTASERVCRLKQLVDDQIRDQRRIAGVNM